MFKFCLFFIPIHDLLLVGFWATLTYYIWITTKLGGVAMNISFFTAWCGLRIRWKIWKWRWCMFDNNQLGADMPKCVQAWCNGELIVRMISLLRRAVMKKYQWNTWQLNNKPICGDTAAYMSNTFTRVISKCLSNFETRYWLQGEQREDNQHRKNRKP